MNDVKGEVMSHKRFLSAAVLVVVIAAVGLSMALAGASWRSGSHSAASWVSGVAQGPDDASWVGDPGDTPADTSA
jgi:autotransporter translocation and assembly factor TamB